MGVRNIGYVSYLIEQNELLTDILAAIGGGGGGGDASAANQTIQITEAQTTNSLLSTLNINSTLPLDAAGSVQVSQRRILANLIQSHDLLPLFYSRRDLGSATQVHNVNKAIMSVTGGTDAAIAQTFQFFEYVAGKPNRCEFTLLDFGLQANVEKSFGQYHDESFASPYNTTLDGYRLFNDGADYYFQVFNSGTTLANVPRASWDDPMDGTGPSGITVDFDKFNIYAFDYLWLGGSGVRFFMNIGSKVYHVHTYQHSNNATDVIFERPEQPIRFEIRSTGGAGSMKQICGAASIETLSPHIGRETSVNMGVNFLNANTIGIRYALLGIRLKATEYHTEVTINEYSALSGTNDSYLVELVHNPVIAGTTPTWNAVPNSSIEYAIGATANTVTGGEVLYSAYAAQSSSIVNTIEGLLKIGVDLDLVPDEQWLVITPLSSNLDIYGSIDLIEI